VLGRRQRARGLTLVAAGAAAAALGAARAGVLRRVEVEGRSMLPTLQPGDRLLASRLLPARAGALAALRDPREPNRLLVKRVACRGVRTFEVRGDNPAESTDSRQFGPVPRALIEGRVFYRYAPAERAGRLGARPSLAARQ
jgi:nickel-type superoxide dismutase maturation protease